MNETGIPKKPCEKVKKTGASSDGMAFSSFSYPKELTAEALVDLEIPSAPHISPSGNQVVYSLNPSTKKDKNSVSSLWIAKVGEENSARQLTSGLFHDTEPQWSPDAQSIAFISDRAEHGETSAIHLLSPTGGEAYPITKANNKKQISSFKWSPNGKFIAFISMDETSEEKKMKEEKRDDAVVYGEDWGYGRLRIVHVATRVITTLVSEDIHVNSLAWKEDSREIAYTTHKVPDIDSQFQSGTGIHRISLSDGKISSILQYPAAIGGFVWRGSEIFFASGVELNVSSSTMVYKLPISSPSPSKYAFGVTNDLGVDAFRLSGGEIWVSVLDGLSQQIHCLDGEIIYSELQEIEAWDIYSGENDPVLVLVKSSIETPPEIFSLQGKKITQLSRHSSALADLKIGTVEPLYATAQDGTNLDSVLFTPTTNSKSEKGKPWPTFVHPHGGPYGVSTNSFNSARYNWAPWIVSAGYAVLCPNYRGGSGHGENFASAAIGGMGTLDYDDIISLVKAGISSGHIHPEKVLIGGWSQGGFASYLAVTRKDFKFRGAICGAGVSDWDMMSMTSDVPTIEAELTGKAPWEAGAIESESRHGSPIWHMEDVKTPILILHGREDARVPLTQAIAFHRGCLYHGIPCEFVSYPREGHRIEERLHRLDILKRIRRFIDLHLS